MEIDKSTLPVVKHWQYKKDYIVPRDKSKRFYQIGYDQLERIHDDGYSFPEHMAEKNWVSRKMVEELIEICKAVFPSERWDGVVKKRVETTLNYLNK